MDHDLCGWGEKGSEQMQLVFEDDLDFALHILQPLCFIDPRVVEKNSAWIEATG